MVIKDPPSEGFVLSQMKIKMFFVGSIYLDERNYLPVEGEISIILFTGKSPRLIS